MGYWMWDAKRKSASVAKKETHRIDLPETGFLSSIYVVLAAENGSSHNEDNHLHDCLTKIEVVGAGGETIKSITGIQAQVLNWLDKESVNRHQLREDAGYWQAERWAINFGRYFQDTEYMLDCSKIIDGQLRLTWDLAAVRAVSDTTAFKDANASLGVVYAVPHDYAGPAPKGYIKSTETKQWTTDASGIEYVKIPRDNPIRRIVIRAHEEGIAASANISNLKLNGDNGKIVPFDNDLGSLLSLNQLDYGPIDNYGMVVRVKDADTKPAHMGWIKRLQFTPDAQNFIWNRGELYDRITFGISDLATPTLTTSELYAHVNCSGWAFHNSVVMAFDRPKWNDELLLQAQGFGSLELEVNQGNAGGAASIVTEEVVTQA
ncbi:hypothetical protein LCGC14_1317540 [marine sediment metagenome]|uniref:Uncharacterized protein n=1 Tax=marine sediment metagenome TaxID=412755 RepID=A0A0F9NMR6_9ZZZZ